MATPGSGKRSLSTRAVHAGEIRWRGALTTPIVQTSTYRFDDMEQVQQYGRGEVKHYEYGRYGNPTREAAETKLADLEGAEDCTLVDCGMRAVSVTILTLAGAGKHIVLTDDAYKKTLQMTDTVLRRFGIESSIVPMGDYDAMERAVQDNTVLILSESPTNPYLNVADVERVAQIGRRHRVTTAIDATFASPYNQRPLEWGIDLVIQSGTKFLSGHNDVLIGAVAGAARLLTRIRDYQGTTGGIPDPNACYLLLRGMKTLAVRVERHNRNAMAVAQFLEQHPKIKKVYYPGLPSHAHYELAKRQMDGYGGVVTFDVDGDLQRTLRFIDCLELCLIAPSLGSPETLVTHPATVSYYKETPEHRRRLGITDELVRLAVGLEDVEDIIADLDQALAKV